MLTHFNWPRESLYKIHLDLHCPDWNNSILTKFDAGQTISAIASTGAKVLYFFSKDCYGNAYYATKIGRRHRCIGDRDLLGEVVEEAKRHNILVVAYSVLWDNYVAEQHPDWRMRYADGSPARDVVSSDGIGRWQYLCHNSPFADYMCQMLAEVSAHYDVAGFHLDMLNMDFGRVTCYCEFCQRRCREETGYELPVEPTWDRRWQAFLDFRYRSVERVALAMRQAIHQHRPGLPVSMNYHASPGFDWRTGQQPVRHSRFSDIGTAETYTPLFGNMYPGMAARFVRNLVPGRPFEVVPWRMNRITDFTMKPTVQLRWEALSALSAGGKVMLIDQPFHDGTIDHLAYQRIGEVFEEIEGKRESFAGELLRQVGIYYSARSRDLYGRLEQRKFLLPVHGAYKALVESHFLVDFLFDETASAEVLAEYPVIFLPNVAVMTSTEVDLFRNYVKDGGTLIATGDTSLFDDHGQPLQDYQLREVFGIRWEGYVDCDTYYFRGFHTDLGRGMDPRQFILNRGQAHRVVAETAQTDGDLYQAFHRRIPRKQFFSHNMHPPYTRETSAAFVNRFGKGLAIYFPHAVDASYADEYEQPEHRKLLRNAVELCKYRPQLQIVKAPLNVEVEIRQQQDCLSLHLLAFNPTRHSTALPHLDAPIRPSIRMDEPMLYEAEIRINTPFRHVEVWNPTTQWDLEESTIKLVCSDVHEVVTVRLK